MTTTDNVNKLDELLKPSQESSNALSEALLEVAKEDAESRKSKAKEMIREAVKLKRQMEEAERKFTSEKKRWDKELGKTLARLDRMASGKPEETETEMEATSQSKEGQS